MGWTVLDYDRTYFSPRSFFADILGRDLLVDGVVKSSAFYAAVRCENARDVVRGVVCLIDWSGGANRLAYKIVDECEGPYYFDCPKRIIDLLTPLSVEFDGEMGMQYAENWRNKCLSYRETERSIKQLLSDPRSFPLTLNKPIKLTNGCTIKEIGAMLNKRKSAWVWRSTNGMTFAATPMRIYEALTGPTDNKEVASE